MQSSNTISNEEAKSATIGITAQSLKITITIDNSEKITTKSDAKQIKKT